MTITYKDVGQGDSIILEWEIDGVNKIGIIDCNLKGKINPILNYLIKKNYQEIDFIVLSHPHRDHFSGMLRLFSYCQAKKIFIKKFAHTLTHAGTKFWRYFEVSSKDNKQLNNLIKKSKELKDQQLIKHIICLAEGMPLKISKELKLECLAPSFNDIELYQNIVKNDADKNIKEASQAANHLSTIFKLNLSECYVLFTSDAESTALEGILDREDELSNDKFHLCQIPHHGSQNNHYPNFWNSIKTNTPKHAIISAGKHRTYNHPSFEVIKSFHDDGYTVHCTNILNGMMEYTNYLEKLSETSAEFDSGSEIAEEYRKSNDRIFSFEKDSFKCS